MLHKIACYCKILFVSIVFVACSNKKEDEKLFEELNVALESSNKAIDAKSIGCMMAIHEKMQDWKTHDIAVFWQPKADSIDKLSNELIIKIDSLKNTTSSKLSEQDLKKFYKELINYKQKMQLLDSAMYNDLSKDIQITTDVKNAKEQTEIEFCKAFKTSSQLLNLAICKNRIFKIKASLLEYCDMNTVHRGCIMIFDQFWAIASQNSTKFSPNETLEITAGVGAFSKNAMPLITIDDQPIVLNAEGVAEYKAKVPSKKGKYKKQVKIQYRKPDRTIGTIEKEIIYTVDE